MRPDIQEKQTKAQELYKACTMQRKNPYEAACAIDNVIDGITRVDYDPNKNLLRIYNHEFNMKLPTRGLKAKAAKSVDEVVVIMHHIAAQQQSRFTETDVSSIRITKKKGTAISTKHHKKAYNQYQQSVLKKYGAN